jgi:hypothetical protein
MILPPSVFPDLFQTGPMKQSLLLLPKSSVGQTCRDRMHPGTHDQAPIYGRKNVYRIGPGRHCPRLIKCFLANEF